MYDPNAISPLLRRPSDERRAGIARQTREYLVDINARCSSGECNARALSPSEVDRVTSNVANAFDGWIEYVMSRHHVIFTNYGDDLEPMSAELIIQIRNQAVSQVLARVLDERLWIEARCVRLGMGGCVPAEVPASWF